MIPLILLLAWQQPAQASTAPQPPGLARDLFGVALARAGDLDGDGTEDLWVGDPSVGGGADAGHIECVWAVSGATGEALRRIAAPAGAMKFGSSVCALGDLDGDSVGDLAVTACFVLTPEVPAFRYGIAYTSPQGESAVFLYSGASGGLLRTVSGPADDWKVSGYAYAQGPALAAVGDWDEDGLGDLAVGLAYADSNETDCGRVAVVSTADGSILQSWHGEATHDRLGAALCALTDLDGDGRPELAASALPDWSREAGRDHPRLQHERAGYVKVLSSKGGTHLTLRPPDEHRVFGLSLASFPDEDGDGVDELLIGRPFCTGDSSLRVLSLAEGKLLRFLEVPYLLTWVTAGRESPPPSDENEVLDGSQDRVGYTFGSRLLLVPDRDGDGREDVLVTAADGGGSFSTAFAGVLSSKTGRPIALVALPDSVVVRRESHCLTALGLPLCGFPDMDGDSVKDFALGGGSSRGLVCPGSVVICSGKEPRPIRTLVGAAVRR